MIFTGKNLVRVREGLDLAKAELHNQIATCPDVYVYEDMIIELEEEVRQLDLLTARIDRRHPEVISAINCILTKAES